MERPIDQERRALIDRVLSLDPATYIYRGLGGNIGLIESEIERDYKRVDWMKWDVQNIHRIAVDKAQRGALAPNPCSVEAFQIAFSNKDAIQKSGIGANESMILNELVSRGPLECTSENILQIIGELWDSLADNPQYTQRKTANDLRARRISEMTGNSTHGFSVQIGPRRYAFDKDGRPHDPNRGMAQGFSLAARGDWSPGQGKSFDQMSDTEVENLWNLFRTSQDFRSMSKEQLREIVKKGGTTDLFGNHQSIRLPSAAPRDEGELINPATGVEFRQRELIAYINNPNDPYAGRKLITHPSSGRVIAAKRQRFEEIIKSLRG